MKGSYVVLAGAVLAVALLSAPPAPAPRTTEGPLLPRKQFLHALFAAQQQLVADYFWILTTHQIGAASTPQAARDVVAYADLATDLDPDFRHVYWFAGVASPVVIERDRYANVEESTRILKKGTARFPDDFKLNFQLAQNYLHFTHDFKAAADLLTRVSKLKGAPVWLPSLATRLYAQSGEFDAALEFARQMVDSATDEDSKAAWTLRLKEIRQERILKRLDLEVALFKQKEGRPPKDIYELMDKGYASGLPGDPLMGGWYIDEKDGRARSTANKARLEFNKPKTGL